MKNRTDDALDMLMFALIGLASLTSLLLTVAGVFFLIKALI